MDSALTQLTRFTEKPNGENWATNRDKVKLLIDYIWCRTLTPGLQLATFLERFEPLADYSEENLKHPADAVEKLLPHTKAQAAKAGTAKFEQDQILDLLAIYVDMLDYAASIGEDVSIGLADFLQQIRNPYLRGEIKPSVDNVKSGAEQSQDTVPPPADPPPAKPPEAPKRKRATKANKQALQVEAPVIANNTRVLWTPDPALQLPPARGVVKNAGSAAGVYDLLLDDGQFVTDVPAVDLFNTDTAANPLPDVPFDYDRNPIKDIHYMAKELTADVLAQIEDSLNPVYLDQLPGTFKISEPGLILKELRYRVGETDDYVQLYVTTAVPQPVIVANLIDSSGKIIHALPPRRTIIGEYTFVNQAASKAVKLTVTKS
jgi:hypothetical protein